MQLSTKPGDAGNGEANHPKERTAHQLRHAIPKTTPPQMDRAPKVSSSQVMKHPDKERDASKKACLRLARNTWSQTHQEDLIKFSDKSKPGFTLLLIRSQSPSTSSCKETVFTSAITHPVPDRRTNRQTP